MPEEETFRVVAWETAHARPFGIPRENLSPASRRDPQPAGRPPSSASSRSIARRRSTVHRSVFATGPTGSGTSVRPASRSARRRSSSASVSARTAPGSTPASVTAPASVNPTRHGSSVSSNQPTWWRSPLTTWSSAKRVPPGAVWAPERWRMRGTWRAIGPPRVPVAALRDGSAGPATIIGA